MIELLVFLIFSWIFARKIWKWFFRRIFWFFKRRDDSETYSYLGKFFRGIFIGFTWIGKGIWGLIKSLVTPLIKGIVTVIDNLKTLIWK